MLHPYHSLLGSRKQRIMDKFKAKKEEKEESLANHLNIVITKSVKISYKGLKRLKRVAFSYLDLITDSMLLRTVMTAIVLSLDNFMDFTSQVALILLASIVVPLFTSALMIAIRRPLVILNAHQWKECRENESKIPILIARVVILLFFPIIPAMIILSNETAKEQRELLKTNVEETGEGPKDSDLEENELLTEFIDETRLAFLTFKRNEVNMELVAQLSIHLTMILLSKTTYPIESGLQGIFQESSSADASPTNFIQKKVQDVITNIKDAFKNDSTTLLFLVFSVIWSFKTCALTTVKIKNEEKSFLPLPAKLLLFVRYLLVFFVRVGCIVSYFAPYIGLLDIMSHYNAERIPLDYEIFKSLNETDDQSFHYWNDVEQKFQSVPISQLYRSEYLNKTNQKKLFYPAPPSTNLYTLISLGNAFAIFLGFYIIYGLGLTLFKHHMNDNFSKASHGKRFQHIIETLNVSEAFGDYDDDPTLDVIGHRQKWKKILHEMLIMTMLQFLSNLIMIVPLIITGIYFCS